MRLAVTVAVLVLAAAPRAGAASGALELIGSESLGARGMNSAIAVHGGHAYVGSRSDGPPPKGGIAIVDVRDPAAPRMVGAIGPPDEGAPGESSRELRVWPQQDLLIVLRFGCEWPQTCADYGAPPSVRIYDIRGERAAAPVAVATYRPSRLPHEFFLWVDPRDPARALMYMSTPGAREDNVLVADLSRARDGVVLEVASFATGLEDEGFEDGQPHVHSLSVSPDGRRAYLAHLAAGVLVADTSDLADRRPDPRIRLITPPEHRVSWGAPGAHSAVPLPGRDLLITTDEVYGRTYGIAGALGVDVARGCPWGWARTVAVADPARPRLLGEYRLLPYNDERHCTPENEGQSEQSTFSSHNPTATGRMALVTWHSGGLQVVDLADPARPAQLAEFRPEPLPWVLTEDPTFSTGADKAVMWSYPVVRDGLVYVVDLRNGLYVLRYRGPHEGEVDCAASLEGNSNLGAAAAPCPLTIGGRRLRVRRGRLHVGVTCTTRHGSGCLGRLAVHRGRRALGRATFSLPPGRGRIPVRVRRPGRRGGPAVVTARTSSGDTAPVIVSRRMRLRR